MVKAVAEFDVDFARSYPVDGTTGLRFGDNRHWPALQKAGEQRAIDLQGAVVADEGHLPEPVHEFTLDVQN